MSDKGKSENVNKSSKKETKTEDSKGNKNDNIKDISQISSDNYNYEEMMKKIKKLDSVNKAKKKKKMFYYMLVLAAAYY